LGGVGVLLLRDGDGKGGRGNEERETREEGRGGACPTNKNRFRALGVSK